MDCWRNLRSDCVVITNREASASRFAEASRRAEIYETLNRRARKGARREDNSERPLRTSAPSAVVSLAPLLCGLFIGVSAWAWWLSVFRTDPGTAPGQAVRRRLHALELGTVRAVASPQG